MSNSITPLQDVFLNAYEANLFDFDNINSKVFLTRKINTMMRIFGYNCLIDGFDISNYFIDDNYNLNTTISAGKLIVDKTLIEYKEDVTLNTNVADYDDDGKFIITIGYDYLDVAYSNLSKIGLKYLNTLNKCNEFLVGYDNIVLGVLDFNKTIKQVTINTQKEIIINGKNYEIRPLHNIDKEFYSYMNNILGII